MTSIVIPPDVAAQRGCSNCEAWKLLAEIVRLDAISAETTEFGDFHTVTLAIKSAREVLDKRGTK